MGKFPITLGCDSITSVKDRETFSGGTAVSSVRKGWAITAQTLLIYMRFRC